MISHVTKNYPNKKERITFISIEGVNSQNADNLLIAFLRIGKTVRLKHNMMGSPYIEIIEELLND